MILGSIVIYTLILIVDIEKVMVLFNFHTETKYGNSQTSYIGIWTILKRK